MDIEKRREQKRVAAKTFRDKHPDVIKNANAEQYKKNRGARLAYQKEYIERNKEKVKAKNKERYERKKAEVLEGFRKYRIDNPMFSKLRDRRYYYRKKYGIEIERIAEMWDRQGGRCANHMCGEMLEYKKGGFALDHCHVTGTLRDLLCMKCNVALGNVNESVDRLNGLISYLEKHRHGNGPH